MTGVSVALGLVGPIILIANNIIMLADTAKRNREKCKLLKDHVESITRLLKVLDKNMTPEVWMEDLLKDLNNALSHGKALVESCQKKRNWSLVFKTKKKAKKFEALDHHISRILSQFNVVNLILIVKMTNGRFFENVLQKLLDDGACMRLPQDVKEELKSSIMRLPDKVNVSFNEQLWLDRIKSDITYRPDGGTSGSSGAPRGKEASSSSDDHLSMVNILKKTTEIKIKAGEHKGDDEIQRLVGLLERLTNIIQLLQTSELSLDTSNTRQTLVVLKNDLDKIYGDVHFYNGKEHNKVKMIRFCGQGHQFSNITSDEILKDAYKIEYYNQVLLIALSKAK